MKRTRPRRKQGRKRPWWRKPLRLLLRLRPRRHHLQDSWMHRVLGDRLFEPELWIPNRKSSAKAAAIGVSIGMLPLVGLQVLSAILVSFFMRANIPVAALGTFLSNPFTTGALMILQVKLGQWLLAGPAVQFDLHAGIGKYIALYGKALLLGSAVTAVIGGVVAYPLALWIWRIGERAAQKRRQKSV